jgi:hypothetical protein
MGDDVEYELPEFRDKTLTELFQMVLRECNDRKFLNSIRHQLITEMGE